MSYNSGIGSEQPKEKQIYAEKETDKNPVMLGYNIIETRTVKNQIGKKEGKNQYRKIN